MFDSPLNSVKSLLSVSARFPKYVTSSPTQIPLCAVVNIEITCSNACRNARILSIEIIFSLMKSGKLVDFLKEKRFLGLFLRNLSSSCFPCKACRSLRCSSAKYFHCIVIMIIPKRSRPCKQNGRAF